MPVSKRKVIDVKWPDAGLFTASGHESQPPGTTRDCLNVRSYDESVNRKIGCQRPGLTKYLNAQHSDFPIQDIIQAIAADTSAPSQSGTTTRVVANLVVCNGSIATFNSTAFTNVNTSVLNTAEPFVQSAQLYGKVYWSDGSAKRKFDIATGAGSPWTSANTIPDGKLMCLWGGRIVMARDETDPHNWYMSAVGDAEDWDYQPSTTSASQAVAGNYSDLGKIGDVITALCPYSDDILVVGCDHTIYQFSGNPASGGAIDEITDQVGMIPGRSHCRDTSGVLYFLGSRGGVYRLPPGPALPESITDSSIAEELSDINVDNTLPVMIWDDRDKGLHLFLTKLADQTESTHYFWDARNGSWWKDRFANHDHNPRVAYVLDADDPDDRVLVMGGRDGRIRYFDSSAESDDSTPIKSHIWLGPIGPGDDSLVMLHELEAIVAKTSDDITWEIYVGNTVEEAIASGVHHTGLWRAGRNDSERIRASGRAFFLVISNFEDADRWAIERILATISSVQTRIL